MSIDKGMIGFPAGVREKTETGVDCYRAPLSCLQIDVSFSTWSLKRQAEKVEATKAQRGNVSARRVMKFNLEGFQVPPRGARNRALSWLVIFVVNCLAVFNYLASGRPCNYDKQLFPPTDERTAAGKNYHPH